MSSVTIQAEKAFEVVLNALIREEKELERVYQALSGIDECRVVSYVCHASGVEALLIHLNKQFPPFSEFSVDPSKISVEVISQ